MCSGGGGSADTRISCKNMFMRGGGNTALPSRKSISFSDIDYHVFIGRKGENKQILRNVSGEFRAGQLVAIMGPSGAGKSSLMNILAGYKIKNVLGNILINGRVRDLRHFRKISCYIMQDDQLLPHLTVEEAMMCSANLKLNEAYTMAKKRDMVNDIIDVLGLSEARKTRSVSLSGGQRKRLAIAQELVKNPPIMFFDEPTSGLDSSTCQQCILLLQQLARSGRTIICTIHQPSAKIFEMFDLLYFMAEGQCIYKGPIPKLVPYLSSLGFVCPSYHNPADYLMELACGEHGPDSVANLVGSIERGELRRFLRTSGEETATTTKLCRLNMQETAGGEQRDADGDGDEDGEEEKHTVPIIANAKSSSATSPSSSSSSSSAALGKHEHRQKLRQQQNAATSSPDAQTNCNNNNNNKANNNLLNKAKASNSDPSDSDSSSSSDDADSNMVTAGMLTQFRVLFVRTFMSIIRDTTLTQLRLISHLAVGVTIGLLYFKIGNEGSNLLNNTAFLFFCLLFIMFSALMPTVLTFPLEMSVFRREHLNYWYSLKAYYLAKTFADLPFQIIFPIIYGCIVYWLTNQPAYFIRFFMFLTVCVQTALVGQSIGLVIGAATSLQVAVFLGPVTAIPILLFSGFFVTLNTIPKYLQWVSYLSYVRYSFEGMMQAIYGFNREEMDCAAATTAGTTHTDGSAEKSGGIGEMRMCVKNGRFILKQFNVEDAKFYVDFIVLCVFFVLLRVLCYFILRWRIKVSK